MRNKTLFRKDMYDNPVFRKDMRVLFRNAKVYIGLTVYLVIMTLITNSILKMLSLDSYNGFNPSYVSGAYLAMLAFQMAAITLVVPAFTSSSISGERERQTFDFLLITPMRSWDIVVGKLMSSLLLVCLMIVASMPVYAVVFYYGGVSVGGFIANTFFLLIYAVFVGSIAILFSTMFKKTVAATAVSNLFMLGITIGTITLVAIIAGIAGISYNLTDLGELILGILCICILSFNPIVCFVSIVDSQMGSTMVWEMVNGMLQTDFEPKYLQIWHIVTVMYVLASLIFLKAASKNILPIKRVRGRAKAKGKNPPIASSAPQAPIKAELKEEEGSLGANIAEAESIGEANIDTDKIRLDENQ